MTRGKSTIARVIAQIASADDLSFSNLVEISKLDPAKDFREADLAGVDLGDLNLSGFNFEKANLRGANLRNTKQFSRDKFVGADLRGAKLPIAKKTMRLPRRPSISASDVDQLAGNHAIRYWMRRFERLIFDKRLHHDVLDVIGDGHLKISMLRKRHSNSRVTRLPQHVRQIGRISKTLDHLEAAANPLLPIILIVPQVSPRLDVSESHGVRYLPVEFTKQLPKVGGTNIRLGEIVTEAKPFSIPGLGRWRRRNDQSAGILEAPLGVFRPKKVQEIILSQMNQESSSKLIERYVNTFIGTLMSEVDALRADIGSELQVLQLLDVEYL